MSDLFLPVLRRLGLALVAVGLFLAVLDSVGGSGESVMVEASFFLSCWTIGVGCRSLERRPRALHTCSSALTTLARHGPMFFSVRYSSSRP